MPHTTRSSGRRPRSSAGFTLLETLIALTLLALIFVAFLAVLDSSSAIAKSQTNISDVTENLRFSTAGLVRLVRMAGTGGVPLMYPSGAGLQSLAFEVDDHTTFSWTNFGGVTRVPGTDAIRVRGVIERNLWEIQGSTADATYNAGSGTGTITIRYISPFTETVQAPTQPAPDAPIMLLMQTELPVSAVNGGTTTVRRYSDYRIVRVTGSATSASTHPDAPSGAQDVTINFSNANGDADGDGNSTSFISWNPSGAFLPFNPDNVIVGGVLDDLVFFVGVNDAGEPALYRFGGAGGTAELVPNVANLQVAAWCDLDRDGEEDLGEWFMSSDTPAAPVGTSPVWNTLRQLRLTVVVRTQDPEMSYDETLVMPENAAALSADERRFRHRAVTVRVTLRSHPPLEAV